MTLEEMRRQAREAADTLVRLAFLTRKESPACVSREAWDRLRRAADAARWAFNELNPRADA